MCSMRQDTINRELLRLESKLFDEVRRRRSSLTREWAKSMPSGPGVYAWFSRGKLVYVGETGCLWERIDDCRRTMNHTLRRTIGAVRYATVHGYQKATTRRKFIPEIEERVDSYMKKLSLSVLEVEFGRIEFEEYLLGKYRPKYNKKVRRGS